MKCFIHKDLEARAICTKCGKAMCINCSAESSHSGMCPVCNLKKYQKRLAIWVWTCILTFVLGFLLREQIAEWSEKIGEGLSICAIIVMITAFILTLYNISICASIKKALRQGKSIWLMPTYTKPTITGTDKKEVEPQDKQK